MLNSIDKVLRTPDESRNSTLSEIHFPVTGVTTDAGAKIDHHPPGVTGILKLVRIIECLFVPWGLVRSLDESRLPNELGERAGAQQIAAFDREMILGAGKFFPGTSFPDR